MANTAAVILAAGQGTRMRSKLPKVLHKMGGLALVGHVVQLAIQRKCSPIVVVIDAQGRRVREYLTAHFPDAPLEFAVQEKQLGTGDAARAGMTCLPRFRGDILILYGDTPLLTAQTVGKLQRAVKNKSVALLSCSVDDPTGYGRVVRDGRAVTGIVEHKDCTAEQRQINEINVGVYLIDAKLLRQGVAALDSNNAQGEFYLTDVVAMAAGRKGAVAVATDRDEMRGINTRAQLAEAESVFRQRRIAELMHKGVTFRDPSSVILDASVKVGSDVLIGAGVQLYGRTSIGNGCSIEGPTYIKDTTIGPDTQVHSFCHLEQAKVAAGGNVGPYARLRPEAELAKGAKVGNFVEVKKAKIGVGAKVNHLTYIGDADVGAGSNIGAGTITCNYDGANKHRTVLGRGVFIGSNSTLVAPLKIGAGAYVAAGSTITKSIPKEALAFGRARQALREGYAKKLGKKRKN